MARIVAEDFSALAGGLQTFFESVDGRRRDPVVAVCEMALQWHLDVGGLRYGLGRQAIKANRSGKFRDAAGAEHGDSTAEAETRDCDLGARPQQKLRRAAHELIGRLKEIERV